METSTLIAIATPIRRWEGSRQGENREWDEGGNAEKRRWLKLPLQGGMGWRAASTPRRAWRWKCGGWGVQAKYTEKLRNDKELTSFRKLTNWSTVK